MVRECYRHETRKSRSSLPNALFQTVIFVRYVNLSHRHPVHKYFVYNVSNSPCLWSISTTNCTRKLTHTSRAATVFRFCLTVVSNLYIFCKICANKGCSRIRRPHVHAVSISLTAYSVNFVKRCLHGMNTAHTQSTSRCADISVAK